MTSHVVSVKMILSALEPWKLGEGGDAMDKYILAENMCRLCKEQNISVEQLAELIGKSPRQVNRYRNGQSDAIPFTVISAIADALHTSPARLLSK